MDQDKHPFLSGSAYNQRVIINHDAAIDEYMAVVMLTTMSHVDLLGVVITNADCIAGPAMQAAAKIHSYIGVPELEVSLSGARGWNPFPWGYRGDCIKVNNLPMLHDYALGSTSQSFPDGDAAMARMLASSPDHSVTMLVTGPLTTLRNVLAADLTLINKISHIIWMGGAIDVAGNLAPNPLPPSIANPHAEWNAFWDPEAVDWIFRQTSIPILMYPLDITNQATIRSSFMASLAQQAAAGYRFSALAHACYQFVATESFYDMWDVVTTCYIARPFLFQYPTAERLEIVTSGPEQGWIRRNSSGRTVYVMKNFADADGFYDYVLDQLRR